MRASIAAAHTPRARTVDWISPRWLLEALGPFDLDPCASRRQPWPTAREMIALPASAGEDAETASGVRLGNGLGAPWPASALVWCNPPYGREAGLWLDRLAAHPGGGIGLVFARTDTAWMQRACARASALLFLAGRVTFARPDGSTPPFNSGGPSVLLAYGDRSRERLEGARARDAVAGLLLVPDRALR